jgi:MEMO1 family protein
MVRPAAVSGSFYSANPDTLIKDVKRFLSSASLPSGLTRKVLNPFAVVVPHAGYAYSGRTAAYAYKLIENYPVDTFILIGPSHHTYIEGNSVYPKGSYETPLGSVSVDEQAAAFLLKKKNMTSVLESHFPEHSLEVQLPFLQVVKRDFRILPILIGDYSLSNLQQLSTNLLEMLAAFGEKKMMLVISSDLSHYHSSAVADRIDRNFIDHFRKLQIKELIEGVNANRIEACGSGPIITLLLLARTLERNNVEILDHTNSGKSSGDTNRVVGYFSAVVY